MYSDAFYDSTDECFKLHWLYTIIEISLETCDDEFMMYCMGGEL